MSHTAIDVYKPQVRTYRTVSNPEGVLNLLSQDATTNPSLILAVAGKAGYARLIDTAIEYANSKGGDLDARVNHAVDRLVCRTNSPPTFSC